jgi:multiple sugar transport system permease protein
MSEQRRPILGKNAGRRIAHGVSYLVLGIAGVTMIFPLAWMVATSLKPAGADPLDLAALWPESGLRFENYAQAWRESNLMRAFLNSYFVTMAITLGQVSTSSLAAYAFARMRFAGRDQIFIGYLATMMIPAAVTMIPTFILLRHLGWIDTYTALIIPSMFSAYGTFMLRQFFLGIPSSLEEAAILDGCSRLGLYWHIMLPLSRPALAALGIITFIGSWRNFMWPLIVTHSEALFTLPVALAAFQDMYDIQWPLLMAGSVIMTIPMLVAFLIGQKFFASGITIGAIKG